jgi:hypothetical protein
MARKSKNSRNRVRRIRPQKQLRNTRFTKARRSALRFSPYKAIQFTEQRKVTLSPTPVRRARPQRAEMPKRAKITVLTPSAPLVHTDNQRAKVCKRRHERKQIIHALGKSGLGGQKKPDLKNRNLKC